MTFDESRPFTDPTLRIEYAPDYYNPQTSGGIRSVILRDDEEVEWHWTHMGDKSYVCGYIIVKRNNLSKRNKFNSYYDIDEDGAC